MYTLTANSPDVKPSDLWPVWTDLDRWETTEEETGPTEGADYDPTEDEDSEALALLNATVTDYWPSTWPDLLEVGTVSEWDWRAELAAEAEAIDAGHFFG